MRILLVNPNITQAVTDNMLDEARRVACVDTRVEAVTAPFGTLYVENRAEAAIAGHAVLDLVARHDEGVDGIIISAFGDPGLAAVREFCTVPVVGIAESALLTAWMLGRRITIVCMTSRLRTWYLECAREHGLQERVVAVRALDVPVPDIARARQDLREPLLALCRRSIEEDDAEVVIFGGGPLAGLARELASAVPVPVLDGVSCAVGMVEMLVRQDVRAAAVGSFAAPASKPARGLSQALMRRIQGA